jgi:hypothetical protein
VIIALGQGANEEKRMYGQRRAARHPLTLGLLVALVFLALSACGGGAGGQEQANKPRPLPEEGKALRPGEYRSSEFKPSLTFRVGKGWKSVPLQEPASETSDTLAIQRGGGGGVPTLRFRNLQEVYKYDKSVRTPDLPQVVKAPKDMLGWFRHHPYLDTEKPEPATVGGVKGVQFDYILRDETPGDDIDLFRYADGSVGGAGKGFKYRAIILEDVKGETVTIGIGSQTTEFDEFLPEAQKVLDTVKWTDS